MDNHINFSSVSDALKTAQQTISSPKGNVLVYLIVVVLIFGVLGVTIVSLFTSSTSSSATPNDARRAYYMAESGIRYALSQIRNSNFNDNFIQTLNSTASYNLTDGGSFTINVFSPWFEYSSTTGNDLSLDVPNAGEIPQNFSIPNITLVHWDSFGGNPPPTTSYEPITGSSVIAGNTTLTITIVNPADFTVSTDDIVCLAVQPTDADPVSPLQAGEDIYVALDAEDVFPPRNGAIRIVTSDGQFGEYYYTELIPDTSNNRVRLTNLAALPGTASFTEISNFATDDWVVLSRQNYRLLASGTSGDVTLEVGNNNPLNIFADAGVWTIYMEDLVADAVVRESEGVTNPLFAIDTGVDTKITIGGSGSDDAFGDLWYGGDKPIGNNSSFCQAGRCLFGEGIRAFFTLDVTDSGPPGGEGFIFALISAGGGVPNNTVNSAGGDFQRTELLGYAGDSRTVADGTVTVDGTGDGLLPPKLGVEFDTRTNFDSNFEQTLNYCSDATTLKPDTRNDPSFELPQGDDEHAMQNVFWGNTTLDIACRQNDATYDDNKHGAVGPTQKWEITAGGDISFGRPAFAADGTIYTSDQDRTLFALNPDGTEKWTFDLGDGNEYHPGVDRTGGPADGTIYSDISGNSLVAINPDGTEKWQAPVNSDIDSTPIVGPDGTIYFGTDFEQAIFAINPDGTEKWRFTTGGPVNTSPALSPDGSVVYAVSTDDTLYAVNTATGLEAWRFFPIEAELFEINSSPTVNPNNGIIYVGSDDRNVYAINPDGSPVGGSWPYTTGDEVESTAAVDLNDGTIYIGSDDNRLHAINPDGTAKAGSWPFVTGNNVASSPVIDSDGIIYVGSDDDNFYAVNPDGTERWRIPLGPPFDRVQSSPAIGSDGTIYIGSSNSIFYAINRFAEPVNFRDESFEDKKLVNFNDFPSITFTTPVEWLKEGPWAVRTEILRSTVADVNGNFAYLIKVWIEQCQDGGCTDFLGLLFRDTLVEYNVAARPTKLEQTFLLSNADHVLFERFIFGLTTAAQAGDTQQSTIRNFELSFSRPGDPVVTAD